jgi:hypothetical protein
VLKGVLDKLHVTAPAAGGGAEQGPDAGAASACYRAVLHPADVVPDASGPEPALELNPLLGKGLRIEFTGEITCCGCGGATRRSYGQGYCYPCFRRLARCDLCVVSPVRCHYRQGTCREPAWGESFCLQPHRVYLASTSGPKVGLTRQGRELQRWLDQGAVQGLVVAAADSRHAAGLLEAALAAHVPDRTDWRTMLAGEPPPVELAALRDRLAAAVGPLPPGVRWLADQPVRMLRYPVLEAPRCLERLSLDRQPAVAGRLLGIKGQYLLLDQGVLNVRRHRGHHVRMAAFDLPDIHHSRGRPAAGRDQMELFS